MTTDICLGDRLRIANVSMRTVGLNDTPDASDATTTLGMIKPGAIFEFEPSDEGRFFVGNADSSDLMFMYAVRRCKRKR